MNTETSPDTSASQARTAAPDLRPTLSRAFDQAERVIALVTPEQLTRPTPCTEWDVRRLLSHFVQVARRIQALGEGRSALSVPLIDIPDGQVAAQFHEAREGADRAWADDAALLRSVEVPWGTVPGALVLGGYVPEVTTHTWDLWNAIGSTITLDPKLAETSLAAAQRTVPAERDGFPFGAVVPAPENADPYTRLAGWMGRTIA